MSEDDDYRVEARLAGASRGVSPTTEQIDMLLQRRRAHEKLTRAEPAKPFAQVLGEQGRKRQKQPEAAPERKPDMLGQDAAPPVLDAPRQDSGGKAAAVLPPQRNLDGRRRDLPAGFQRSGRPVAQATSNAKAKIAAHLPAPAPSPRLASAGVEQTAPGQHKVIIRG